MRKRVCEREGGGRGRERERERERERAERDLFFQPQGYVEQDALVLSITKGNPRLKDLYMRPVIGSRRIQVRGFQGSNKVGHFINVTCIGVLDQ